MAPPVLPGLHNKAWHHSEVMAVSLALTRARPEKRVELVALGVIAELYGGDVSFVIIRNRLTNDVLFAGWCHGSDVSYIVFRIHPEVLYQALLELGIMEKADGVVV